ncbi:hypothetical protein D3C80_1688860 [compost metagenome]
MAQRELARTADGDAQNRQIAAWRTSQVAGRWCAAAGTPLFDTSVDHAHGDATGGDHDQYHHDACCCSDPGQRIGGGELCDEEPQLQQAQAGYDPDEAQVLAARIVPQRRSDQAQQKQPEDQIAESGGPESESWRPKRRKQVAQAGQ